MAYWIHENGETIGPLKAIEILERAQPETLVSHGQEWIPLSKHPDFSFQAVQSAAPVQQQQETGSYEPPPRGNSRSIADQARGRSRSPGGNTGAGSQYWILPPDAKSPLGPYSCEEVRRRGNRTLRVSFGDKWLFLGDHPDFQVPTNSPSRRRGGRLGIGAVVVGAIASLALAVLVIVALTRGSETSMASGSQSVGDWVYSEPINYIQHDTLVGISGWSEERGIAEMRAFLPSLIADGDLVGVKGPTALVTIESWRAASRPSQMRLLENIALANCGCADPSRWQAEIRDATTNDLLIAISPNGMRALWTQAGFLPEMPRTSNRVELSAPMDRNQQLQSALQAMNLLKIIVEPTYIVSGVEIQRGYTQFRGNGVSMYASLVTATARPVMKDKKPLVEFDEPTYLVVAAQDLDKMSGIGLNGQNAEFTLYLQHYPDPIMGEVTFDGMSYPLFSPDRDQDKADRYVRQYIKLSTLIEDLS